MNAKPIAGEFPYIDPADENSKYYTKPDVPPIPHPAEVLEDLKKEFPDKPIEELVKMADDKVNEVIEQRRAENDVECQKMLDSLKEEPEEEEPEAKEARAD